MSEPFDQFVRRATRSAYGPYDYQVQIAEAGLPHLLGVPTGAGKTLAAVLPWLWRLVINAETGSATPHRLIYVLPMRTLVEQTAGVIRGWLEGLGLTDKVQLHVLMGGMDRDDDAWQANPAQPAIFVGTQDMILSRALMRGYAEPRSRWPISYALLHAGTQWVFDETQLLGPALGTSAQLQGLREALGTAMPTATMWMSATLDQDAIWTPDHRTDPSVVELTDADRTGQLRERLSAVRRVSRTDLPDDAKRYPAALAETLLWHHAPGTQTIAILNTVDRATQVYAALRKLSPECELMLVHSRFRPAEREHLARRINEAPGHEGRILISTQVLEAGVDTTSRTLFTEAAPWSSIVQRAGRCNRGGEHAGVGEARLLWSPPPKSATAPYEPSDLAAAIGALTTLEGQDITSTELQGVKVEQHQQVYSILRRRDLLQLFDTAPDLLGADVDVGPWIRDGDEATVFVAWRNFAEGKPAPDDSFPARGELCPAPVGDVRKLIGDESRRLWAHDRINATWRWAFAADVVPGAVFLADAATGGYDPELGWAPKLRDAVPPVGGASTEPDAIGRDHWSYGTGRWVELSEHLADVEREALALIATYDNRLSGLRQELLDAVPLAGRLHDLGKAHPAFQDTLLRTLQDGDVDPGPGPWAKSSRGGGRHIQRPYLRHELVSALMLLHPDSRVLDTAAEADLVAYLVAAHHGKVRVSVRSVAGEAEREPRRMLGVERGDEVPATLLPGGGRLPALRLDPEQLTALGSAMDGRESWTSRVLRLRDREDVGPFRLAFLETLVRIADWRASQSYREEAAQ